ncbi:MAG: hypothetical protein JWL76_378 [Thermoleophilia bacterium]|nr:hypothetical protein [Thermoleophilia bacterium]
MVRPVDLPPRDSAKADARRQLQRALSDPGSHRSGHRRLFRRPQFVAAAIVATAGAVMLIVALAPENPASERTDPFLGPNTAAAQVLVQAGDSAADVDWAPLRSGEYFHVYTASIPPLGAGQRMTTGPVGLELWLDRSGQGQAISVQGAIDPSRVPSIIRGQDGEPSGYAATTRPPTETPSLSESLAKPNSVTTIIWTPDAPDGHQLSWVRQLEGFVQTHNARMAGVPNTTQPSAEANMRQQWGLTIDQVESLPTVESVKLDRALQDLLDDFIADPSARLGRIPTGAFGSTAESIDHEERIEHVVKLLGGAPLSPAARKSLYRWLAMQPDATVTREVRDAMGREGVRVEFRSNFEQEIPARQVTVQQLIDNAQRAGISGLDDVSFVTNIDVQGDEPNGRPRDVEVGLDQAYSVPAHRQEREWVVSIVIDPDSGELLQHAVSTSQRSTAGVPELMRNRDGQIQLVPPSRFRLLSETGASISYLRRDRVKDIDAVSPVCAVGPEVCDATP